MADTLVLTIAGIILIAAATFAVGEVAIRIIARLARKAGVAPAIIRDIREGLSVLMIAIAVTGIARFTGLTSEFTTLAVSGVGGLAISLALQTTLSNIISGILMFHDNVLRLGDEIEYSAIKGKVVKIGFRSTWVQAEDDAIVVISNTSLSNGPLTNRTAKTRLAKVLEGTK